MKEGRYKFFKLALIEGLITDRVTRNIVEHLVEEHEKNKMNSSLEGWMGKLPSHNED